ncbi:hypothetical protein N665_0150s0007 [Sinapis alba]|nr:hypothetical protein N665_0150s0007 [Sinapis alba]
MKQMVDAMRDGFGMILREIKHVADMVEVVAERVEALGQLAKSTKGTASNEAPHTPSELPKHDLPDNLPDDLPDLDQYSRRFPGSCLVSHLIRRLIGSRLSESENGEKGDPRLSKEDTEMKEAEEARGTKEAEEANALKEAEEANAAKEAEEAKANAAKEAKANAAKEAEESKDNATKEAEEVIAAKEAEEAKAAKSAKAVKAAKEADAAKVAKEAKALKVAKASKALRDAKAAKEARDAKSVENAKAAKKAREAKEARDAEETKEVKEAEEAEEGKASEGSIVIMDKQKPTTSDLETEKARKLAKSEAVLTNIRAMSERERKLTSSQQSPFQGNSTSKIIIPNKKIGRGYDPFTLPVDKRKSSALTDMLKKDRKSSSWTTYQTTSCKSSGKSSVVDEKIPGLDEFGAGCKRFRKKASLGGAWDLYGGVKSTAGSGNGAFVNMILYLLVECAATVEERCKYSLEPFMYEVANAPQCESGDCGIFTLKYIECHALGFPFYGSLNPNNSKAIREKMAVDIFEEIPDVHQTEITDVDINQDMYD